jgi:hypothetical protein
MTQENAGVVIIAKESNTVDYLKIAVWNAKRAQKYLGLPVTIITDSAAEIDSSINVVRVPKVQARSRRKFPSHGELTQWNNAKRWEVCELTPYDRTLLIDADYIINSDYLNSAMQAREDFLVFGNAFDVTGREGLEELSTFGAFEIPLYWATAIVFSNNDKAGLIFGVLEQVENNYEHYATIYKFEPRPFRNDYALSIALNLVNGLYPDGIPIMPWPLMTVLPEHKVTYQGDCAYTVRFVDDRPQYVMVTGQDLHIMGKADLEAIIDGEHADA